MALKYEELYKKYFDNLKPNSSGECPVNCPFGLHEDRKPSMSVNLNNGYFNCFSCGTAGSAVGFIMKMDSCDLHAALQKDRKSVV